MNTFKARLFSVFVLVCLLASFPSQYVHAQGLIIYVKWDATGPTHDGSSWTKAYTDLQSALAATRPGAQIWVAAGTYKPTTGSDRSRSFQLQSGVKLYGGFAGNETTLLQRDPLENVTILSGDIGTPGMATDNSYHVIKKISLELPLDNAALDGFTVTGGNSNTSGGGLDLSGVDSVQLTLKNMIFRDNISAWDGGGVFAQVLRITLENVTFENNTAKGGGGLFITEYGPDVTSAHLRNVTFNNNTATDNDGGGLFAGANELSLIARDLTFNNNQAAGLGGGMYLGGEGAGLNLKDVTFEENIAKYGGGLFLYKGSRSTLDYATFTSNKATGGEFSAGGGLASSAEVIMSHALFKNNKAVFQGGAIENVGIMTISDSTFHSNITSTIGCGGGGAIMNDVTYPDPVGDPLYGELTVINSTFYGNRTTGVGGGIHNRGIATISYSTFSRNSAAQEGAGIYNAEEEPGFGAVLTLNNSILANSAAGRDCLSPSGSFSGDHNLIENNGVGSCACGSPLLTSDPNLGPLQHNGGFTPTMALLSGSPVIDAGDDAVCPDTDQRGILRPKGSHCDLGAYEALPPAVSAGIYDDTDVAWQYTGAWTAYVDSGVYDFYNDTMHYTGTVGDYAELRFTGTQFIFTYTKNAARGLIDVYVDGSKVTTLNAYSASDLFQQTYTSPVYTTGNHIVRFVHAGGGTYIDVDAITILP